MTKYLNKGGDSGINEYDIGADYIIIHFWTGKYKHYKYSYIKPGREKVEIMKKLAERGEGLNEYINRVIKKDYETRW